MTKQKNKSFNNPSFSKRYGYEPLPQPMQLEELSEDLRREIWNALRDYLLEVPFLFGEDDFQYAAESSIVLESPIRLFVRTLGKLNKIAEDEISAQPKMIELEFKSIVIDRNFNVVLDLIEVLLNSDFATKNFHARMETLFKEHAAAYQLDSSRRPYQFSLPQSSEEQGEAIRQAIETLRVSNFSGATTHLRQAAEHIRTQQYADSITDSIHAVESVACMIAPQSRTLGSALKRLETEGLLKNQVLKKALEQLYGYTNDERGLRHALTNHNLPDVGPDEAMLMYGACASFASYLVNKHRQVEKQETSVP